MRPMFIDLHEVLGRAPPPPGTAAVQDTAMAVMQRLNALYKDLLHAVKEEALLMEQIFPDPGAALAAFISRVFEQKIKARNLPPQQPQNVPPLAEQCWGSGSRRRWERD